MLIVEANNFELMRSWLVVMQYRKYLETHLKDKSLDKKLLPTGYHLIGHVALLSTSIGNQDIITEIAELTIQYDQRIRSVAQRAGPTNGIIRTPSFRLICGDSNTVTTHVENGVKFRLDPLILTFSGGNRRERIEFPRRVREGEHVVDMFACVGQFGLHVATRTKAKVTAIEINPIAYQFLQENILINKVQNRMQAILGDCRKVEISIPADRIIMGYLHDTIDYLPVALNILSPSGGWIHLHMSFPSEEIKENCNTINTICKAHGFDSLITPRKIKHYSPGIVHYVFDIELEKSNAES